MKKTGVLSILFVAVLLAVAVMAEAQQPKKVPHIGYLTLGSISSSAPRREAFRDALRNLGYVEGQNIIVEYRYADGKTERLPELASEMVRLNLDVIVAGGTQVNLVVKKATDKVP